MKHAWGVVVLSLALTECAHRQKPNVEPKDPAVEAIANLPVAQGSATSGQQGSLIQETVAAAWVSYTTSPLLSLTTDGALRTYSSATSEALGPAGPTGKSGTNGTAGRDGAVGPRGEFGPTGPKGDAADQATLDDLESRLARIQSTFFWLGILGLVIGVAIMSGFFTDKRHVDLPE